MEKVSKLHKKQDYSDFMLAVMTLSAVKWSYFCIEYCTDVSTVIDFSTVNA